VPLLAAYEECLARLRRVREGDRVSADDFNVPVMCMSLLADGLARAAGPSPELEALEGVLRQIPRVRAGEVIRPEHHNLVVDALWAVRDALRAVIVMGQLCPAAGLTFGCGYLPWPGQPRALELARVGDACGIPEMEAWHAGASPATELAVTAGAKV
jgi:hypothetical protein